MARLVQGDSGLCFEKLPIGDIFEGVGLPSDRRDALFGRYRDQDFARLDADSPQIHRNGVFPVLCVRANSQIACAGPTRLRIRIITRDGSFDQDAREKQRGKCDRFLCRFPQITLAHFQDDLAFLEQIIQLFPFDDGKPAAISCVLQGLDQDRRCALGHGARQRLDSIARLEGAGLVRDAIDGDRNLLRRFWQPDQSILGLRARIHGRLRHVHGRFWRRAARSKQKCQYRRCQPTLEARLSPHTVCVPYKFPVSRRW